MKNMFVLILLLLAIGGSNGIGQEIEEPWVIQRKLDQSNQLSSLESLSVRDAFIKVLNDAHIMGGLELVHCGDALPVVGIEPNLSIRASLDRIMSVDSQLSLDISPQNFVNLRRNTAGLLDVRIANVEIPDFRHPHFRNPLSAVRKILNSVDMQSAAGQFRLWDRVEAGMGVLPRPGVTLNPPEPSTYLRNITFREALNSIAQASGSGVWVYQERRCSPDGSFTISFSPRHQMGTAAAKPPESK